jgi:hypothetical protein
MISIQTERNLGIPSHSSSTAAVGIDLGVINFATFLVGR